MSAGKEGRNGFWKKRLARKEMKNTPFLHVSTRIGGLDSSSNPISKSQVLCPPQIRLHLKIMVGSCSPSRSIQRIYSNNYFPSTAKSRLENGWLVYCPQRKIILGTKKERDKIGTCSFFRVEWLAVLPLFSFSIFFFSIARSNLIMD